jgi:IS30 family transposase
MGASNATIARWLGRSPSTISREIRRNRDDSRKVPYLAVRACRRTRERRVAKGALARKIQGDLQEIVETKLRMGWSPEQISGRLWTELRVRLSHETIYQHVIRDAKRQGTLRYALRYRGYKQYRCKKSKCADRTRARKGWLHQRPQAANNRSELGHWERDCLLGQRGKAAFLTLIERRSRFTRVRQVAKVNSELVAAATIDALRGEVTKTVTNDNGVEFQRDESLQRQLGVPIYFTDPGCPWQRGSIENLNGLIRQYIPKGDDIDALPDWTAQALEETLNYRPRRILGFRTPHEVFYRTTTLLMSDDLMHLGLETGAPT